MPNTIKKSLYLESIKREYNKLLENAERRLKNRTKISDFRPGSIAKSILQVYYNDVDNLYEELYQDARNSYLSTSSGQYLEELGELVSCYRDYAEQEDEGYKAKIYHNPQLKAKGNKKAVVRACTKVEGVNRVKVHEYTRGIGSFDIFVISKDPETSEEVLEEVQKKINEVQSSGIDGRAVKPTLVYIDLYIRYIFHELVDSATRQDIRDMAEDVIREYIINKDPGGEIIINNLIKKLMSVSTDVQDVRITDMYIDGKQTLVNNKEFNWDQRLVPNEISIR